MSPMPFGGESCEDPDTQMTTVEIIIRHQCLSAGSPVRTILLSQMIQDLKESPMPFGGESCEDIWRMRGMVLFAHRSPMPFGGESCEDADNRYP